MILKAEPENSDVFEEGFVFAKKSSFFRVFNAKIKKKSATNVAGLNVVVVLEAFSGLVGIGKGFSTCFSSKKWQFLMEQTPRSSLHEEQYTVSFDIYTVYIFVFR